MRNKDPPPLLLLGLCVISGFIPAHPQEVAALKAWLEVAPGPAMTPAVGKRN